MKRFLSRRQFLQSVTVAGAALQVPGAVGAAVTTRRVLLVGATEWGRRFVRDLPNGYRCVGVCDVLRARRDPFDLGAPLRWANAPDSELGRWADLRPALAESTADLVVVSVPDHARPRIIRAALDRGCDVVTRGPAAPTTEEWLELEAVARRRGRALIVPAWHRADPELARVRASLLAGEHGRILSASLEVTDEKRRAEALPPPASDEEVANWCAGGPAWPMGARGEFPKALAHWREILGYGNGAMSGPAWDGLDLVHWLTDSNAGTVTLALAATDVRLGFLPYSLRTAPDRQMAVVQSSRGFAIACHFNRVANPGPAPRQCRVVTERRTWCFVHTEGRWRRAGAPDDRALVLDDLEQVNGRSHHAALLREFEAMRAAARAS